MAYLENCLPVQKYEAEEFAGDSILDPENPIGLQPVIQGNPFELGDTQVPSFYYLVIEAMPGYNIQASMINIGGVLGINIGESGIANETYLWSSSQNNNSTIPGPEFINQEAGIRAKNSSADPSSCDNKVFIRVALNFDFTMPANDVDINIDFGGAAVECSPYVAPEVDPGISLAILDYRLIIGNGVNANTDCNLFVAKYYESLDYAASSHDFYNQTTGLFPPTTNAGDPNWSVQNPEFFTANPSALDGFQPTYYNRYKNQPLTSQLWNLNNTNNITTECGQLIHYESGAGGFQPQLPIEHPNYSENPIYIFSRMNYRYVFFPYAIGSGSQSLFESHPFLVPGDGVLPSSLCWYISVGNNANYELMPENVDVYKIIGNLEE